MYAVQTKNGPKHAFLRGSCLHEEEGGGFYKEKQERSAGHTILPFLSFNKPLPYDMCTAPHTLMVPLNSDSVQDQSQKLTCRMIMFWIIVQTFQAGTSIFSATVKYCFEGNPIPS